MPGRPSRERYRDPRSQRTLGKAIRALRRQPGLTQKQLGERAEIDGNWISRIESGQVNLVWGNLRRIAYGLEVPLEDLISLAEEYERTEAIGLAVAYLRVEQGFQSATVAKRAGLTTRELEEIEGGKGPLLDERMEGKLRRGLRIQKKRWFQSLEAANLALGTE
jgi:transcriptional regulator with XRE-family HTH domain